MFDKANSIRVGILASLSIVGMAMAAPAQAQRIDYDYIIGMAEMQGMATQKMAVEALLVAMNVKRDENMEQMESTRALFDQAIKGLQDGDPQLRLPATANPEIRENLERAQEMWVTMNAALPDGFVGQRITRDQVATIADISADLQITLEDAVEGFVEESSVGDLHSMLTPAVQNVGRIAMLSQQMAKEFLLVTYGHEANRNRMALGQSTADFETRLSGLINGNYDMLLLPAPTPELRQQLQLIERIWQDEFKPLMGRAEAGDTLGNAEIFLLNEVNDRFLGELNSAATLYELL